MLATDWVPIEQHWGDLAHQEHHADHHEPGGEHDCSGLFHTCLCHSTLLVTLSDSGSAPLEPSATGDHLLSGHDDRTASGFPERLFRPPIA